MTPQLSLSTPNTGAHTLALKLRNLNPKTQREATLNVVQTHTLPPELQEIVAKQHRIVETIHELYFLGSGEPSTALAYGPSDVLVTAVLSHQDAVAEFEALSPHAAQLKARDAVKRIILTEEAVLTSTLRAHRLVLDAARRLHDWTIKATRNELIRFDSAVRSRPDLLQEVRSPSGTTALVPVDLQVGSATGRSLFGTRVAQLIIDDPQLALVELAPLLAMDLADASRHIDEFQGTRELQHILMSTAQKKRRTDLLGKYLTTPHSDSFRRPSIDSWRDLQAIAGSAPRGWWQQHLNCTHDLFENIEFLSGQAALDASVTDRFSAAAQLMRSRISIDPMASEALAMAAEVRKLIAEFATDLPGFSKSFASGIYQAVKARNGSAIAHALATEEMRDFADRLPPLLSENLNSWGGGSVVTRWDIFGTTPPNSPLALKIEAFATQRDNLAHSIKWNFSALVADSEHQFAGLANEIVSVATSLQRSVTDVNTSLSAELARTGLGSSLLATALEAALPNTGPAARSAAVASIHRTLADHCPEMVSARAVHGMLPEIARASDWGVVAVIDELMGTTLARIRDGRAMRPLRTSIATCVDALTMTVPELATDEVRTEMKQFRYVRPESNVRISGSVADGVQGVHGAAAAEATTQPLL